MKLTVEKRDIFGKNLKLSKEEGKLPVVLYGQKVENTPLFVVLKEFLSVWKEAGESTLVELNDGKQSFNVLIQDVAIDPVKNIPVHVDFLAVAMDKLITTAIPLVFEGEAPAVKALGGVLVKVMHEIEIEALPANLPHELKVDLSVLKTFNDKITLGDIKLPAEVNATAGLDEVVALTEAPKEEQENDEAPSIEDIQVEKKGKKEAEDGESDESK